MKPLTKRWLLLGLALLIVAAVLFLVSRSAPETNNWVLVSKPVFASGNNSESKSIVALEISNAGPARVDFWVDWFECRTGSDRSLVPAKPLFPYGLVIHLSAGARTNLAAELSQKVNDAEPLLCYEIGWVESESRLRPWLRQIDRPIYWVAALLQFNWSPPWRGPGARANGRVFVSSIDVQDYFSRIYGFTRKQWLEELRKDKEELALMQARGFLRRVGYGATTTELTVEQRAKLDAKAAYERFCRAATNNAGSLYPPR